MLTLSAKEASFGLGPLMDRGLAEPAAHPVRRAEFRPATGSGSVGKRGSAGAGHYPAGFTRQV